jgi:cyclase
MSTNLHGGHEIDLTAQVVEVAERVYAYIQPDGSWMVNNTGFIVGSAGVISIDATSTARRTQAYLDVIRKYSDQPVTTLINTHHHADHTFGNYLFTGATIVGHERSRESVLAAGLVAAELPGWEHVDFGDLRIAPPFLTYETGVTLWSDDMKCEVRYVGRAAHTTDDSTVWIPELRVLFTGDLLFAGGTPFVLMGSIRGILRTFDDLEALGATTVIAGHGPIGGPEIIDRNRKYLQFVQRAAVEAKSAGLTPLEASRELELGQWAELLDPERIVGNLYRAYLELNPQIPLGAPLDLRSIHAEMIDYNGGRPLRCYA